MEVSVRPQEVTSAKQPASVIRFDAMRMVPWPDLDQQLGFVAWASTVLPWDDLLAFDAPGTLVVILAEDEGLSLAGETAAAAHRRRCGYLDLVWRHEDTWQRVNGEVVELAPDIVERMRCDVAPYFDGSEEGAATICRRFGPRADGMMQLRLTEAQRAPLVRLQLLVDRCQSHLLDDFQRGFIRDNPEIRSNAQDLEPSVREFLISREQLAFDYLPLHRRETSKLWGAIHRLGSMLGYRLH